MPSVTSSKNHSFGRTFSFSCVAHQSRMHKRNTIEAPGILPRVKNRLNSLTIFYGGFVRSIFGIFLEILFLVAYDSAKILKIFHNEKREIIVFQIPGFLRMNPHKGCCSPLECLFIQNESSQRLLQSSWVSLIYCNQSVDWFNDENDSCRSRL